MAINNALLTKILMGVGVVSSISIGGYVLHSRSDSKNPTEEQTPKNQTQLIKEYVDSTLKKGWKLVENTNSFSLTFDIKDGNGQQTCSVTPTNPSTTQKVKENLENKFGTSNLTENNKKNRRGFITRCLGKESLNLVANEENSEDLLDFFNEELNEQELQLTKQDDWQIDNPTIKTETQANIVEFTITISASKKDSKEVSVGSCKITSYKKKSEEETINESNIANIKSQIETHLKTSSNKETNRKNFLLECKRSFDNEIKVKLIKENSGSNYQIEDLDKLFEGTLDQG